MTKPKAPKRKVLASTAGGLGGVQVADFANWCVDQAWFSPDAYPGPVSAFISGLCIGGFAFVAGYLTPSEE